MGWAALEHSVYRPPVHRLVTRVELNDTARDFLEESIRGHRSKSRKERIIAIVVIVWVGTQLAQRALRGEETLEFIPIAIVVLAAVFVVWAVFFSVESVQGNRARK